MARVVTVDIRSHPLSREENGVVFDVSEGNARFGQLIVSKGGLRWKARGEHDHLFISWLELDGLASAYPKR
jgi:hypothetical protein